MTALLELVLRSFWTWSGTVLLVLALGSSIGAALGPLRKPK